MKQAYHILCPNRKWQLWSWPVEFSIIVLINPMRRCVQFWQRLWCVHQWSIVFELGQDCFRPLPQFNWIGNNLSLIIHKSWWHWWITRPSSGNHFSSISMMMSQMTGFCFCLITFLLSPLILIKKMCYLMEMYDLKRLQISLVHILTWNHILTWACVNPSSWANSARSVSDKYFFLSNADDNPPSCDSEKTVLWYGFLKGWFIKLQSVTLKIVPCFIILFPSFISVLQLVLIQIYILPFNVFFISMPKM